MKKFKSLVLGLLFVSLNSCAAPQDENYFFTHPLDLKIALDSCPGKEPPKVSCASLKKLANRLSIYINELQRAPQDFGKKILLLQQELATSENPQKKLELHERLSVVALLMSPES